MSDIRIEISNASQDVWFVSSPSSPVLERAEYDGEEHNYEFHPKWEQRPSDGSK